MDAWNFIAFGGLERIIIIGAATLIGYWGYRIFASSRGAGLTLLTGAALVLVGALLTTGAHLDRLNDTLLASNTRAAAVPPEATLPATHPTPAPTAALEHATDQADELAEAAPAPDAAAADAATLEASTADASASGLTQPDSVKEGAEALVDDARVPRLVPLASGQELGGRITSVRSEKVTLEWSEEVSGRRVISSSREP